jgi:hypothetical protein
LSIRSSTLFSGDGLPDDRPMLFGSSGYDASIPAVPYDSRGRKLPEVGWGTDDEVRDEAHQRRPVVAFT